MKVGPATGVVRLAIEKTLIEQAGETVTQNGAGFLVQLFLFPALMLYAGSPPADPSGRVAWAILRLQQVVMVSFMIPTEPDPLRKLSGFMCAAFPTQA
jgi:hypothetical protein